MKVGFTGTRHGMTAPQLDAFRVLLARLAREHGVAEFHHGDCIGADDQAATYANLCEGVAKIIAHPPIDQQWRAFNVFYDRREPTAPYKTRDRRIVEWTDVLIAAPAEMANPGRGGTWYTLGYAEKQGRPVWVCWPDGTVSEPRQAKELTPPKGKE